MWRTKATIVIFLGLALIGCRQIRYTHTGYSPLTSRDTVLVSLERLDEYSQKIVMREYSKISCPVILFAKSSHVQTLLFKNAVILSRISIDTSAMQRLRKSLGVQYVLEYSIPSQSRENNQIIILPKANGKVIDEGKSFWLKVQCKLYDLKTGKLSYNLTTLITSTKVGPSESVMKQAVSTSKMFKIGLRRTVRKLTQHCSSP